MLTSPIPKDYANRPRNPSWEAELLQWLREQPEKTRLAFLLDLMKYQVTVALKLAHNSLTNRESFVKMLEIAVADRDASTIKYWLECIVPRLGFRRTAAILRTLADANAEGVAKALYWLPRFAVSDVDKSTVHQLRESLGLENDV